MSNSPSSAHPVDPSAGPVPETLVREQLERIVSSPGFLSSARLSRFLTHVVNRTIAGGAGNLKEFSIALEVFDRTSDYDPNIDAIVRVEARRLRTKLKSYYEDGPGQTDPVLIGIRPGSYVPIFRWLEKPPERKLPEIASTAESCPPSVAVLPFVNMSPETDQDYFCDGITEEIINALTRVPGMKVIARTSAFQFKGVSIDIREVGQRLAADLVIEGSVRKAGKQLRITAQAIETASGHHLWSETYRRELNDVFAIQEEIAQCVAVLLRLNMPRGRISSSARNLEAYTRYLRARVLIHQQSPESLRAAVHQLRELVQAFPDYPLAHSSLAAAIGLLCHFGIASGRDLYPEIKASAERGYALDPESGETCTVLGAFRAWFEYRWNEADSLYEHAIKIQPGYAPAYMFHAMELLCRGDMANAGSTLRRSAELDPLSAADCARMAYLHYVKGDDKSASHDLARAFELDRDYPEARFYEGLVQFRQKNYDDVVQRLSSSPSPIDIGLLAAAYARKGSPVEAQDCIGRLRSLAAHQHVTPLAEAFSAIGMESFDLAFQRLDDAIEHKTNFVNMLGVEPFFAPLRRDKRFPKLLQKLNLPT
jgi:adenylate cyclase